MTAASDISVCVITWNSVECVGDCLSALLAQTRPPREIVVVDNASTDGTLEEVRACGEAVRVIANDDNLGFAAAANQGFAGTRGALFATVNPDVVLEPTFLAEVVRAFDEHPEAGMVSGCLVDPDSGAIDSAGIVLGPGRRASDRRDPIEAEAAGEVFATCGAAGVWRRETLDAVAYADGEVFDEAFFAYKEDVDVGWRAQKLGWRAWYTPTARAAHARGWKEGGAGRKAMPLWVRVHSLKNRYLMLAKNETLGGLLRHGLPILWFEVRAFVYLLLFEPGLWRVYPAVARGLPQALRKRRCFSRRLRESGMARSGSGK